MWVCTPPGLTHPGVAHTGTSTAQMCRRWRSVPLFLWSGPRAGVRSLDSSIQVKCLSSMHIPGPNATHCQAKAPKMQRCSTPSSGERSVALGHCLRNGGSLNSDLPRSHLRIERYVLASSENQAKGATPKGGAPSAPTTAGESVDQ